MPACICVCAPFSHVAKVTCSACQAGKPGTRLCIALFQASVAVIKELGSFRAAVVSFQAVLTSLSRPAGTAAVAANKIVKASI